MRAGGFKAVLAMAGVLALASVGLAAPAGAASGPALYGFGTNQFGELGNLTRTTSLTPVAAALTGTVKQVATGLNASAALMSDGTVWTWGENNSYQLGTASPGIYITPTQVNWLSGVARIAMSPEGNGYAVKSDGTVWAWGDNSLGQFGNGTTSSGYTPPAQVLVPSGITQVSAGGDSSLALRSDGTVWAWGQNTWGQLGDGTTVNELIPEQVPGLNGITQVATSAGVSFAVRSDGTLFSWGYGAEGVLGNGTTTNQLLPEPVPGLTGVTQVATNDEATLAVAGSTERVWAWGDNHCGELGDGTTANQLSPEQIGLTGVTQLAMGQHWLLIAESAAVRSDGTLWTWGCNSSGELGLGTVTTNVLIPTQVTALTAVSQFAFGQDDNTITQCCAGAYGLAVGQLPTTLVPSLTGDTVATAGTALKAAGLVLGTVTNVVDPTCGHIGKVLSQSPVAGTRVLVGSAVAIRIGTRPAPPAVCQ
jgi:alpha-tubulin suppressor-like RCC1 family protein